MSDPLARSEMIRLATEAALGPPSASGSVADWRAWTDRQAAWKAWCEAHPRVVAHELLLLRGELDRAEPLIDAARDYTREMNRPPRWCDGHDYDRERAQAVLLDVAQEYSNG